MAASESPDDIRIVFNWLDDDLGIVVHRGDRIDGFFLTPDQLKRRRPIPAITLPARDLKAVPPVDLRASDVDADP